MASLAQLFARTLRRQADVIDPPAPVPTAEHVPDPAPAADLIVASYALVVACSCGCGTAEITFRGRTKAGRPAAATVHLTAQGVAQEVGPLGGRATLRMAATAGKN